MKAKRCSPTYPLTLKHKTTDSWIPPSKLLGQWHFGMVVWSIRPWERWGGGFELMHNFQSVKKYWRSLQWHQVLQHQCFCEISLLTKCPGLVWIGVWYHLDLQIIQKNKEGKIIVLYDEDERLGPNVATTLVQRGYDNLFLLSGGKLSWIRENA